MDSVSVRWGIKVKQDIVQCVAGPTITEPKVEPRSPISNVKRSSAKF